MKKFTLVLTFICLLSFSDLKALKKVSPPVPNDGNAPIELNVLLPSDFTFKAEIVKDGQSQLTINK